VLGAAAVLSLAALPFGAASAHRDGAHRDGAYRDGASYAGPNDLVAKGHKGAVVSAEPHATQVGLDVLRAGGNAVDAAVATALALAVTHPQAGNLGGGGFMVLRMADGRTTTLDFRERAPAAATRDMYLRPDGSVDPDKSLWGATAAGVPGAPAGLALALEKFGTMSLGEVAAPAIGLAKNGFEVSHFLADSLAEKRRIFDMFPSTQKVFYRDGQPLRAGERLVQPDLAATLERFAEAGPAGFYRGRTAELIVAQMERDGGFVAAADLVGYEVAEREPLVSTYRGYTVVGMPPPSSGGIAVQQMLNMLEPYDVAGMGYGSARSIHLLTEVMRRAYADRARWLGDSDFFDVPIDGLVSKEYAKTLGESIRSDRVTEVAPGTPPGAPESKDTTHFSVVDAAGNAVSCTTTINSTFGSGLVVDGAGFLLNNEMDDFSAKPGVPNQFGLVGGEANAIAPGKRMLSSMTPTIVLEDGQVRLVLGSPGGGRIINTVLQVMVNQLDHGMSLVHAVQAPRIHHQWKPAYLQWETNALNPDSKARLEALGHTFRSSAISIGRCQAIEIEKDGTRIAVADPRSGGAAAAY